MLHLEPNSLSVSPNVVDQSSPIFTLSDFKVLLARYLWLIVASVVICCFMGVFIVITTPPSYIATSKLLIESQRGRGAWQESGSDVTVDSPEVESQVEVLRSDSVSSDVVRALSLDKNPEFVGDSSEDLDPLRRAISAFGEHLAVRRLGQSYVIEVAFRSRSPITAARVANEILSSYLRGSWRYATRAAGTGRFTDDVQKDTLAVTNGKIITPATVPLEKSSPKVKLILLLSILSGLVIGIVAALILKALDQTIRSAQKVRSAFNIPAFVPLPQIASRRGMDVSDAFFEAIDHPFSAHSDALRSMKVSMDLTFNNSQALCIGVMSVTSGAGASMLVSNLGSVYATSGLRVLLIDANFRSPTLTKILAPSASQGLIELLKDNVFQAIKYNSKVGAWILPLVRSERISSSVDFLCSPEMASFLDAARVEYDIILLDLPALDRVIDGCALSASLDQALLVVEWGRTRTNSFTEAIAALNAAKTTVRGVVLNKYPKNEFGFRQEAAHAAKTVKQNLEKVWEKVNVTVSSTRSK